MQIIVPDARCLEKQNIEVDGDLSEEMARRYSSIGLDKKVVREIDTVSVDMNLEEEDLSEDEFNEWDGEETDRQTRVGATVSSDLQVTRV